MSRGCPGIEKYSLYWEAGDQLPEPRQDIKSETGLNYGKNLVPAVVTLRVGRRFPNVISRALAYNSEKNSDGLTL